jgi:hypothetical protein
MYVRLCYLIRTQINDKNRYWGGEEKNEKKWDTKYIGYVHGVYHRRLLYSGAFYLIFVFNLPSIDDIY